MPNTHKIDLEIYKLLADTIDKADNLSAMGTQVIRLLVGAMEVKGATLFVVNPRAEELEILATEGLSINYVNKGPILVDKSIKLESNLEPVVIPDTSETDRLQYPEKAEKEGIKSVVSLPINLKGKIIGALRIYHSEPWKISDTELGFLEVFVKTLGMAFRNFRLTTEIQAVKERLEDIHPIWL